MFNMVNIKTNPFFGFFILCFFCLSCTMQQNRKEVSSAVSVTLAGDTNANVLKESVLVSDEEMNSYSVKNNRIDNIFDDFIYFYINDSALQQERTRFPLLVSQTANTPFELSPSTLYSEFGFMKGDYTTMIYPTSICQSEEEIEQQSDVTLERIDLNGKTITSYNFKKENDKWMLVNVSNDSFADVDANGFLSFYSRFSQDEEFRYRSLKPSIKISMMVPDDDSQTIDGFIKKEQFSTVCNDIPSGIITNTRYGHRKSNSLNVTLEKISIGNGMSEMFYFSKIRNRWQLVGYEN